MTLLHLSLILNGLTLIVSALGFRRLRKRVETLEAAADHRTAVEYFSAPPGPYKSSIRSPDSIRKVEDANRRRR